MSAPANIGWINASLEPQLLAGTEVIRRLNGHLLIGHDSIPACADHVTIEDGAYRVISNPSAEIEQ